MPTIFLFFFLFISSVSHAYPEFIGYGYTSCLTCHFNGHGNGPINDYGRALWSAEIASRAFAGKTSDEELGAASGFLGKHQLPWYIRPGIKARDILIKTNPGGSGGENRNILMQADANLALLFDKKAEFAFIASYGYAPAPARLKNQPNKESAKNWISREHYFRYRATKNLWLYAGMLDKVYGIRIVDHTAYSRSMTGLGQNDQSHSVIGHYIQPQWEFSLDAFVGNLYQSADLRQKGISTLFEYELAKDFRLGTSLLTSNNNYVKNERWGVHSRMGFTNGSALLLDTGFIKNTPKEGDSKTGLYLYSENIQKLVRGYHLTFVGQLYKDDVKAGHFDVLKWSTGFLIFPMARLEYRLEFENTRRLSSDTVSQDSWTLLNQLHISL